MAELNPIKEFIQNLIRLTGYELHRKGRVLPQEDRATMGAGLQWLAGNGFRFATVLDVGASDGRWSAECMRLFPDAGYVLFEPQPVHGAALERFAAAPGRRVRTVRKAVGATTGSICFDATEPFGGVLTERDGDHVIRVEMTSLDAELDARPEPAPYLLKLDTHGVERSILSGAAETLRGCEALIIEAYNYRITGEAFLFWELCAHLGSMGFRVVDACDLLHRPFDGSLWQMDLFFIRDSWPGFAETRYW